MLLDVFIDVLSDETDYCDGSLHEHLVGVLAFLLDAQDEITGG